MDSNCPFCDSVIYSRRNVLCGVCGERLPDELLFNDEQRGVIEREITESKRRAREARESDGSAPGLDTV
jgi:hypothetical protein